MLDQNDNDENPTLLREQKMESAFLKIFIDIFSAAAFLKKVDGC